MGKTKAPYGTLVMWILLDQPKAHFSLKRITAILEETEAVNRKALERAIKKLIADEKAVNYKGTGLKGSIKVATEYKNKLANEQKNKDKKVAKADKDKKKAEDKLKSPTAKATAKKKAAKKRAAVPKSVAAKKKTATKEAKKPKSKRNDKKINYFRYIFSTI